MNTAVTVTNLSKEYVLGNELVTHKSFGELLVNFLKLPFIKVKRLRGEDSNQTRFWALRDVSFTVKSGEVIGIIGRNGAGKSTLLKILSRITSPSEGSIEYKGRITSLLEVGTGFHPELTGRENIFLNGSILGMSRKEIEARFDDIASFAEIEEFLDTPVKRYSSGMYVRLAFSVAAHLDHDILVVDEVLAVGDQAFQKKCLGKLHDTAKSGRTVFFVSHNMTAIRNLCERILYLKNGCLAYDGAPAEAINAYLAANKISGGVWQDKEHQHQHLKRFATIGEDHAHAQSFQYNQHINCQLLLDNMREDRNVAAVRVTDLAGNTLFTSWDRDHLQQCDYPNSKSATFNCQLPAKLLRPGDYVLTALVRKISDDGKTLFEEANLDISISGENCPIPEQRLGLIAPTLVWHYEQKD